MVNTDKAVESEHRANQLQIRLTNLESRASDREADMKDRIRLLEERLVAITEATLLSSSSKADLSSASTSRGDLPIASPDVSPFISPNDSASDICVEKMLSQPTTNASGPVAVNPEKNMLLSVALLAEVN
ncbi:unnamed protein product [Protopolystoma xenopodis]|uniref:Uncharacterized protein n=1 Tax=Protopolystoma xenopodis TaxID=117903 RepID=A0A3S5CSB5_9PLAT|nr:unnamed protein product [Protopolystoma xenopodis]